MTGPHWQRYQPGRASTARGLAPSQTSATLNDMTSNEAHDASASGDSIYEEFDSFLKVGIKEYYERGWKSRKGNFIALLIASGQTSFALAKDSVVDGNRHQEGRHRRGSRLGTTSRTSLRTGADHWAWFSAWPQARR